MRNANRRNEKSLSFYLLSSKSLVFGHMDNVLSIFFPGNFWGSAIWALRAIVSVARLYCINTQIEMKWKWLSINEWKQMPIISMANRKHHSILIRNGMNWFAANDPFHGWWFLLHLVAVMNLDCVSGWPFLYTHCRALNIITYFLMSPMCVNVLCAVRCACMQTYKFGVRTGQAHVCTNPKEKFIFFFHNNRLPTVLYKRKPNKEKHIHTHACTHPRNKINFDVYPRSFDNYKVVSCMDIWTFGHFSFVNLKSKGIKIKNRLKSSTMPSLSIITHICKSILIQQGES